MKALTLAMLFAPLALYANGPTVKLDEKLNPMPQMQQEHISLDRETLKRVQKELTAQGFFHSAVDGIYGPKTERALLKFQAANDLSLTGEINRETLAELKLPEEAEGAGSRPVEEIQGQEARPVKEKKLNEK